MIAVNNYQNNVTVQFNQSSLNAYGNNVTYLLAPQITNYTNISVNALGYVPQNQTFVFTNTTFETVVNISFNPNLNMAFIM